MQSHINLDTVYVLSDDIVAREIEGELIIVPLVAGIGDTEDELFTLNETGRAIWARLDGKRCLKDMVVELRTEFDDPEGKIETDVLGLMEELSKRKIVAAVSDV